MQRIRKKREILQKINIDIMSIQAKITKMDEDRNIVKIGPIYIR